MKRVWLAAVLVGCAPGGGGGGGGDGGVAPDAGQADAAVQRDRCVIEGYEPGACCDVAPGVPGMCVLDGCTNGLDTTFHPMCLALCAEACIVDGALGPCCQTSAGVGRCEGAECVGEAGREASDVCAALEALPEGVGCGREIPKTPLDADCAADVECETGFCHPAGYCSQRCPPDVECPMWFVCEDQQCRRSGRLGQGCQDSGQCQSGLCIRVTGEQGPYCTVNCDAGTACPEPMVCDLAQEVCLNPQPE